MSKIKEEDKKKNSLGKIGVDLLSIALSFYTIFLYYLVWGWYLETKFFEVTYWELYLGVIVVGFILGKVNVNTAHIRMNRAIGYQTPMEELSLVVGKTVANTFIFGILYFVHVLIVYYS